MLNPARHMMGKRQTDWITMPSVVPIPSRSRPKLETVSAEVLCSVTKYSRATRITTTLLMTGVHMLGPNRPRTLSTAPSSESIP